MVFDMTKKDRVLKLIEDLPLFDSVRGYKFKLIIEPELKLNDDISISYIKRVAKEEGYTGELAGDCGLKLIKDGTCQTCLLKEL